VWILIGEYSFFLYEGKSKKDLKKILKELEGKENFEVVELKHEWNGSLESLEEYILKNSEVLLEYPFFRNKIKKNNTTIQDFITNELKKAKKNAEEIAEKLKTTIKLDKFIEGGVIEVYKGDPPKHTQEEINHFVNLLRYRSLLIPYNLIQEKVQAEIKQTPKPERVNGIPVNPFFINLQNQGDTIVESRRLNLIFHKTGVEEKSEYAVWRSAIKNSLQLLFFYYIGKGVNEVNRNIYSFNLEDLMENIGLPKRYWGGKSRGYSEEQKRMVLDVIINDLGKPISVEVKKINESGREELRRLLNVEAKEGDLFIFTPYNVWYSILYDPKTGIIKGANIKLGLNPDLNPNEIIIYETDILRKKLDDPHFRLFSIWITNGKRLCDEITVKPPKVLKVAKINIDEKNPKRTKEKFENLLERAKKEGEIKDYAVKDIKYGGKDAVKKLSLNEWLEVDYVIYF